MVFVSKDHPFFHRVSISIHELNAQNIMRREQGSATRMAVERTLAANNVEVESVLDIGSREGVWKAVEQGLAIGFVADFEHIAHPRLKIVHIDEAEIRTKYWIAYLSERKEARFIKSFADIAMTPVAGT